MLLLRACVRHAWWRKPAAAARYDRASAPARHGAALPRGVTSEHVLFLLREELIESLLARDPLLGELVVGRESGCGQAVRARHKA